MSPVPKLAPKAPTEYLRRNLLVAKAIGAQCGAAVALDRLAAYKRPPKWLLASLRGILERCEPLPADLARWRDLAPDAPGYVRQPSTSPGEP